MILRPESRTERLERCRHELERNPESGVAHYNLGLAYQVMGRFQQAEKAYLEAIDKEPELVEAWVNLGGVRLHMWDFDGCLEASKRAVELREELAVAHFNLGQAYLYKNDPENLVRCTKRVIEIDREHAAGHYFAAVGLLAIGDLGGAKRHLGRAMELGHRPTPELMKAMEKAERSRASGTTVEIPGVDTPETSKED